MNMFGIPDVRLPDLTQDRIKVRLVTSTVPVSDEVLRDSLDLRSAVQEYQQATPQQREEWRREAAAARAEQRAVTVRKAVTAHRLLDKLGWTPEYAAHFVQPYCECENTRDGWEYCEHARDEGVTP